MKRLRSGGPAMGLTTERRELGARSCASCADGFCVMPWFSSYPVCRKGIRVS
jgi:uncharacterized protein YodC (DUF2158 family)